MKAFILSFESDPKVLYQALDAIDRYVFYYNDEYGLYVKSRIHMALGNKAEAAKCLFDANMTTRSPLLLYRLGRLKEQEFSRSGVVELYDSFVSNPSSGCCLRCLKKSIKTNNIKLQLDVKESNPLILSFVTEEDEWKFYTLYEKLLNHDAFDDLCPPFGEMSPIIDRFIRFLHENESLFHKEDLSYDEDSNLDHYRHPYDSPYYNDSLDMDQQSPEFWDSL